MSHIKISVQVLDKTPPKKAAPKLVPLMDRAEYASAQIEAGTPSKDAALLFIRTLWNKLETAFPLSKEQQKLQAYIKPILDEYGRLMPDSPETTDDN